MDIQIGDRVLVNVAPFIGSARRNREYVPCRVLAVDETRAQVCTEEPYRTVALWVASSWIERKPDRGPHYRDARTAKATCSCHEA